jgi:hypothetical protein
MHDSRLRLELEPRTSALEVIVHHHLRAAPTVSWRMGTRRALQPERGWLLFFDPGERPVELCEAPSRPIGVREARLEGEAAEVQLKPTLLTRLLH